MELMSIQNVSCMYGLSEGYLLVTNSVTALPMNGGEPLRMPYAVWILRV